MNFLYYDDQCPLCIKTIRVTTRHNNKRCHIYALGSFVNSFLHLDMEKQAKVWICAPHFDNLDTCIDDARHTVDFGYG